MTWQKEIRPRYYLIEVAAVATHGSARASSCQAASPLLPGLPHSTWGDGVAHVNQSITHREHTGKGKGTPGPDWIHTII